jgi:hypothetical protein
LVHKTFFLAHYGPRGRIQCTSQRCAQHRHYPWVYASFVNSFQRPLWRRLPAPSTVTTLQNHMTPTSPPQCPLPQSRAHGVPRGTSELHRSGCEGAGA